MRGSISSKPSLGGACALGVRRGEFDDDGFGVLLA